MPKDCIILVADLDAENAMKGLLARPLAMGCRSVTFDIFRHPRRDPGVRLEAASFLKSFADSYSRAIVILDRHGSGLDQEPAEKIEHQIEGALTSNWSGRSIALVIDPEVEAWVWSDSPEVDKNLGWHGRSPSLREWLVSENLSPALDAKPADPKRAYERALFCVGKARSASIFESLGKTVSTRRCSDRAFLKLRGSLSGWFPPSITDAGHVD